MSDTYNFGPTVPALFAAHERRYQEAQTVIGLRDAEIATLREDVKILRVALTEASRACVEDWPLLRETLAATKPKE